MEIRNHIYKFEVDNKETGKYIKRLRKEKGWTAEELAEKIYCSPKTISSWETGVRMPSLDMLVCLSELFRVSVHSILLPLDNCSCDYIGAFYDASIGCVPEEYNIAKEGTDDSIARLYIREEYLLQRICAKVFNQKDRNELITISNFIDSSMYPSDPIELEIKPSDTYDDLLIKWVSLRIKNARKVIVKDEKSYPTYKGYTLFKLDFLFRRLYGLHDLSKTLKAINIIEKSILLTTCLMCKNIRMSKFAEDIYNAGGMFIKDVFNNFPSEIQGILDDEPEYSNEYREEKEFYIIEKEKISPVTSCSFMLNKDMQNYCMIMNYVMYVFYKNKDKKLCEILKKSSVENYREYVLELEREGQINA